MASFYARAMILFCVAAMQIGCEPIGEGEPPSREPIFDSVITEKLFGKYAPNRNAIYTLASLKKAAKRFPKFLNEGSDDARKREAAAFLANVTQEAGEPSCADGTPVTLGKCLDGEAIYLNSLIYVEEVMCSGEQDAAAQEKCSADYCDAANQDYLCQTTPTGDKNKQFFGRGALQLSWNYNYGAFGKAIGEPDLWKNPQRVAEDGELAFASAIWFWMNSRGASGKSTPHEAMVSGEGFGRTIAVINGGIECSAPNNPAALNRVAYYEQICDKFDVDPGQNLQCYLAAVGGANYCGANYNDALCASAKCDGTDASCASAQKCFAVPGNKWCGSDYIDALKNRVATDTSFACPGGQKQECSAGNDCFLLPGNKWCGAKYEDACSNRRNQDVRKECADGKDSSCTRSEKCFSLPMPGCAYPKIGQCSECWNVCGSSWTDAKSRANMGAASLCCTDSECESGQSCFAGPF